MKDDLPLVIYLNPYVVETLANIQFGRILGTTELWDKLRDEGKWILVLNYYGIKSFVIL